MTLARLSTTLRSLRAADQPIDTWSSCIADEGIESTDAGTAVEINSRPERRDPPTRLLELAMEIGCVFSIDTDAHAPGQLEFLGYGAQRALDAGLEPERIVNTWSADTLLDWTRTG